MCQLRRIITACLFLLVVYPADAGVFDVVKNVTRQERIAKAQEIYNSQLKFKDSVLAITAVEQLISIARQIEDKALECFAISMLADHYARIRNSNGLSTQLHLRAIQLAEKNGRPLISGICNYRMGRYYYSFKNYPFAFEYLLRADNFFRGTGYKDVPDIDEILYFLGSIYYETGNFEKAESIFNNIQQLKKIDNYIQKQLLNTLALIKKQQGDTTGALRYF